MQDAGIVARRVLVGACCITEWDFVGVEVVFVRTAGR